MNTGLDGIRDQVSTKAVEKTTTGSQSLGKDDFLKLLVTQLSSQDPLNPLESQDFGAQLAQFSTLEQITNVNTTLQEMITAQKAMTNSSMIDLIGKQVDIKGKSFNYISGQPMNLNYQLGQNAENVFIDIFNASGGLVKTFEGSNSEGSNLVPFTGLDSNGKPLSSGLYSFHVRATDESGNQISSETFTTGKVTDVLFENNNAFAIVNGEKIPAEEISRISIQS